VLALKNTPIIPVVFNATRQQCRVALRLLAFIPWACTPSAQAVTPDQDFQARCNAPGVLRCEGWDTATAFVPGSGGGGYASGLYPADDGQIRAVQDTTNFVSGGSSLKFVIPPGSVEPHGTKPAGFYFLQFGPDGNGHKFGEGSDFYLQFRYRLDPQLVNYDWTQAGGQGWKVFIVWGPIPGNSCTSDQFVQENTNQRNIATGYTSCSQPELSDFTHSPQLLEQGDYNCPYGGSNAVYTNPPCFVYPTNVWITDYWHVHIGTWGSPNTTFQAWTGVQGQALKQFINLSNFTWGDAADHTVGLQMIEFTPYFSGANGSTSTPGSAMWIDEFIVSTQPIATPADNSGTPLPPSLCDVTGDGQVNVADVQKEVNMDLQIIPCTNPSGTCNVSSVQKVVNAALGGPCVAP
jgi:hypothetical protein